MKRLICTIIAFSMFFNFIILPVGTDKGQEHSADASTIKKQETVILVAHGYGGKGVGCKEYYAKYNMFPGCTVTSFDFPDSPRLNNGKVDDNKTCFAQEQELKVLKENFEEQKAQGHKVLLMGVSRGAMCVMSTNFADTIGIFAESPGASLQDVIDNKCKQFGFGWVPFLGRFVHRWFIRPLRFKNYDPTGNKPIEMAKNIPLNMPIFIVYTTNDNLVPASSSVKIAEELVRTGHTEVYLYESNFGYHAHILGSDKNYDKVSNAFLKKCGAIDASYDCANGDELLKNCKVSSLDKVISLRKHLEWVELKKYCVRNLSVFALCAAVVFNASFLKKKAINFINILRSNSFSYKKITDVSRVLVGL